MSSASVYLLLGVGLMLGAIAYPIITYNNKQKTIDFGEPRTVREWLEDFNWKIAGPTEQNVKDLNLVLGYDEFWNWSSGKVEPMEDRRQ